MNTKSESSAAFKSTKQFEIAITRRKDREFELDKVEGDSLIEVLAKFLLVIVQVQGRLHAEELRAIKDSDDDIPF